MARRRKGESKSSVKTIAAEKPAATTAVRKSRRQIAKKQLDKKVNGESTIQMNKLNSSEDLLSASKESEGDTSSVVQHKKFGKYRCAPENSTAQDQIQIQISEANNQDTKINAESSDSQDTGEKISSNALNEREFLKKTNSEEVLHVSDQVQASDEVIWQEDVIEETIEICEEMEVDEDAVEGRYTISQEEGSVVLEEVLLVNNHDFEGEGVVEYTVIRNEDGTESMVVARDDETLSCKEFVAETLGLPKTVKTVVSSKDVEEIKKEAEEFKEIEKRVSNITVEENYDSATEISDIIKNRRSSLSVARGPGTKSLEEKENPKELCSFMSSKENCEKREEKIVSDVVQTKLVMNISSSHTCDKLDSGIPFLETNSCEEELNDIKEEIKSVDNISEENFLRQETAIKKSEPLMGGFSIPGEKKEEQNNAKEIFAETRIVVKEEAEVKSSEDIQNEESSGDSEVDTKADTEDIKLSSSSENSNDTLMSSNSYKLPEFSDVKNNIPNQQNETDQKKTGFRSRSGSTDTTGSESGSNSSGVRRSSRIRSIGLMKQRSRGRGLVTKPSLDLSRAIFNQDREKLSSVFSQDSKDNSDNQSETQSDKESSGTKSSAGFFDSPAPLASSSSLGGIAGYESDSSKPVKVKSRWRRSSELEMGGSSSSSSTRVLILSGESDASASENVSSLAGSPAADLALRINNGTKNSSLPTLTEAKDREMEERLSQFEHLRENLYLTERYTNKETKRMVCDCFLTDEEIARGELGCGEDCLNRLLMIECGSRCVVGERCTNKRFQNCEYAKCEVFRTDKKGFGLRAIADLQSGEFLMEYVGEVVDPKDFRRRAKEYSKDKNRHYYFMALKSDQIIDATTKGNISRFINHSCSPNSETQKWTVNGELRIGFFNKQFIAAGEEITFDYHFQRYGKEAQKCYCEAENCRGWIGETPEEEKEKTEKKEKAEKDIKKKKEEKKTHDFMEDEDLEEEIEKLCSGGLKNRAHTLTLSRLMVRSRELDHRTRLLRLIQSGEQPCRRLFLDYHGLRLIWSYMMDVAANSSNEAQNFRLEILKTLSTLPIPNKTLLMDSKVFAVVEKWAKQVFSSPSSGSPEEEDASKSKINSEEVDSSCDIDSNEKTANNLAVDNQGKSLKDFNNDVQSGSEEVKVETAEDDLAKVEEQNAFNELANSLLCDWSNLKEVFRIPKKERIEQMKEHEREADRGYKEDLEKEDRRNSSYERSRYSRGESDKRLDRRRGRDSPDFDYNRGKEKRGDERANLVPIPRMSKYERRQLFALKVAKEEEERQRRQQQETWQEHEARCLALGMDPHTTAALDPQTGYPLFFNPAIGQWQHYPPIQDGPEIAGQCPVYMGGSQALPALPQAGIIPGNGHLVPGGVPAPVFGQTQSGSSSSFNQLNSAYPPALALHHHHDPQFGDSQIQQISSNLIPIQNNGASQQAVQELAPIIYADKNINEQIFSAQRESLDILNPPESPPPLDLPPRWKFARDSRGRTYYYHIVTRVSQWLPPRPDHLVIPLDSSSSTAESSDESSSSEYELEEIEDEDGDDEPGIEDSDSAMDVDVNGADNPQNLTEKVEIPEDNLVLINEPKKRRDGLVQERIISPRREEERVDHKKYKETKEKLKRQKEKAKLKEHVEKLKKHRRSSKSKAHARHTLSKLQAITADPSTTLERKIKDTFRINMANVMVHFLNPYRKNDCKQGRITNTEDFKHLARKLTHFVLAKELKHCKSVDELQCNENVKHKAKDFVKKYMSKFGPVYQKASDEDIQ